MTGRFEKMATLGSGGVTRREFTIALAAAMVVRPDGVCSTARDTDSSAHAEPYRVSRF